MSRTRTRAQADEDDLSLEREVSVSRYPGREPVTVRTTRVRGEAPSREERMRVGLKRLLREGRTNLGS
jgi:hypothetical protein